MRFIVIVALLLVAATSISAGTAEGKQAYAREDYPAALHEFEAAAADGDAEAQFYLGYMHAEGLGVQQDQAKAIQWYGKSADGGYAPAQYNLGLLCERGEVVPRDNLRALQLFEQAAGQGHVKAQYSAGNLCEGGDGLEPDLLRAYFWFELADDAKYSDSKKRRKKVAKKMTDREIALADLEVRLWRKEREAAEKAR